MQFYIGVLSALIAGAAALPPRLVPPTLPQDLASAVSGNGTFTQPIDHQNPSLGTFTQRYWYNDTFWGGPGSPVVFFTPGEIAADPYTKYLTDSALTGAFAKEIKGAVILFEHRFWGESLPFVNQTTKNLQYHTLDQSIADMINFAKNVQLPFDTNSSSNAPQAPWVFSGGSYSGALSAWVESLSPGTFWAYHSSSAPVEAIYNYWTYFRPVQEGMPKNCSADLSAVVDSIDNTLLHGSASQVHNLKAMFGLQDVVHNDDFVAALENGPWLWQSNAFYTGYSEFFQMCDAIEGVNASAAAPAPPSPSATPPAAPPSGPPYGAPWGPPRGALPGPAGVGVAKALPNFANWFKTQFLPGYCANFGYSDWTDPLSVGCFDTYNATSPMYTDISASNAFDRPWVWMTCNEPFDYWQTGAPEGVPSLVSRLVTPAYVQHQCGLFFPPEGNYTYGAARGQTAQQFNARTGGWNLVNTTRLTWTTGGFDPWRTSGVGSGFRPGGPLQSRPGAPVNEIPGGFHCSDLLLKNAQYNAGVQAVVDTEIAQIGQWVQQFYQK